MHVLLQSLYRVLAFWRQQNDLDVSTEKDPNEGESPEGERGTYADICSRMISIPRLQSLCSIGI